MSVKTLVLGPLDNNCYIYTDDKTGKTAVIDPAFECDELDNLNPDYILLTHAHADHIMALYKLKNRTNAKVVCSEQETKRLADSTLSLYDMLGIYSQPFCPCTADIIVADGDKITLGDTIFTVMHTPGHTDGSVCYITNDTIFSGDTMFLSSFGRTDFQTGSLSDMVNSFKRLFELDGDYTVLPGHGYKTMLSAERRFNPIVRMI